VGLVQQPHGLVTGESCGSGPCGQPEQAHPFAVGGGAGHESLVDVLCLLQAAALDELGREALAQRRRGARAPERGAELDGEAVELLAPGLVPNRHP
jgi:hypothetical protein